MPDTEGIDRLFLELSQFTKARTKLELQLHQELQSLLDAIKHCEQTTNWTTRDAVAWAKLQAAKDRAAFTLKSFTTPS